jgi:hypothetical protein
MRLAFDLGLHVDMTPYVQSGNITTAEAEVRRVAFWGSYIADQYVSYLAASIPSLLLTTCSQLLGLLPGQALPDERR